MDQKFNIHYQIFWLPGSLPPALDPKILLGSQFLRTTLKIEYLWYISQSRILLIPSKKYQNLPGHKYNFLRSFILTSTRVPEWSCQLWNLIFCVALWPSKAISISLVPVTFYHLAAIIFLLSLCPGHPSVSHPNSASSCSSPSQIFQITFVNQISTLRNASFNVPVSSLY